MRSPYVGSPLIDEYEIDAELVEQVISDMKRGSAAGLENLTAEHLQHCHSLLPCVLAKLFNWFVRTGCVPDQFGLSYTVPLSKNNSICKNVTVDNFRGISITPVLSKVFEHCVFSRYKQFFATSDNQF